MKDIQFKIAGQNNIVKYSIEDEVFKKLTSIYTSNVFKDYIKLDNNTLIFEKKFFQNKVPNVHRYNIEINSSIICIKSNKDKDFIDSRFYDKNLTSHENIIFLSIESPHKSEFDSIFKPLGPAQGNTGDRISNNLDEFIKNINIINPLKKGVYKLFIVNPIPCQTSLYYFHKENLSKKREYEQLRDYVWEFLWNNYSEFKNLYNELIQEYKPKVLINACTNYLRSYITHEILNLIENNVEIDYFYEVEHPSLWEEDGVSLIPHIHKAAKIKSKKI